MNRMNKRTFTWIMLLMGLSIAGIILVQIIWITNAIGVKNNLFDRSVNEALSHAVQRLEDRQNFQYMTHFGDIDSLDRFPQDVPPPPRQMRIIRDKRNPVNTRFEFKTDSGKTRTKTFTFSGNERKQFRTETIVVADRDTIVTDARSFFRMNQQHLDTLNSILDSLHVGSPGLHQRLDLKRSNLRNFTHRIFSEMNMVEQHELPLPELAAVVRAELADKDIPIPFELAVSEDDTIRELSAAADSLSLLHSQHAVRLYPHAVFNRDRKLHVYFPGQGRFIYRSVAWLLTASLLFSLIILLTFTLSILFMLRQKKISEMKTDFINNMTHEFKTPIATISVAADSILNGKVIGQPGRIQYYVEMIKKENIRMNRQVEDILTIARLDKKEFEFNWEAVNVHRLIEEVSESISLQIDRRGGTLVIKPDALNPVVTSDRLHGANLIYNLLDNANKYSEDCPQIEIVTRNVPKGLMISVSDKGIGMSKAVQSRIFERFYRQPSGNIHNVKGFGLGLSYVRAVLEANKGSIRVSSEVGKGSRFEVFLPFVRE